jgi:hypothetical protein
VRLAGFGEKRRAEGFGEQRHALRHHLRSSTLRAPAESHRVVDHLRPVDSWPWIAQGDAMIRVARCLCSAAFLFAPAVLAEPATPATPEPVRFTSRPLTFNAMIGLGTPVGGLGGVVEYNLSSRFAVGAGAGVSWYSSNITNGLPGPVQIAALVRYRAAVFEGTVVAQALDVTGALSTGRFIYPAFGGGGDGSSVTERAYWIQAALEYELVTRGGFRFATGPGIALLAAASDVQDGYSDYEPLAHSDLPTWIATFDLTFGFGI